MCLLVGWASALCLLSSKNAYANAYIRHECVQCTVYVVYTNTRAAFDSIYILLNVFQDERTARAYVCVFCVHADICECLISKAERETIPTTTTTATTGDEINDEMNATTCTIYLPPRESHNNAVLRGAMMVRCGVCHGAREMYTLHSRWYAREHICHASETATFCACARAAACRDALQCGCC